MLGQKPSAGSLRTHEEKGTVCPPQAPELSSPATVSPMEKSKEVTNVAWCTVSHVAAVICPPLVNLHVVLKTERRPTKVTVSDQKSSQHLSGSSAHHWRAPLHSTGRTDG